MRPTFFNDHPTIAEDCNLALWTAVLLESDGNDSQAARLLDAVIAEQGSRISRCRARALALSGRDTEALDVAKRAATQGRFIENVPGSWGKLVNNAEFKRLVEATEKRKAAIRDEIDEMIERGEIILPNKDNLAQL